MRPKKKGVYQKKHKHVWEDFSLGFDDSFFVKRCKICDLIKSDSL